MAVTNDEIRTLAAFRLALRQFQSFSEQAAEARGLTSQQYQALLAIGEDGAAPITVTLLAQRLLIKHNSAVGLVDRMVQIGLVARRPSKADRRSVVIEVTARGESEFRRLARAHRRELQALRPSSGATSGTSAGPTRPVEPRRHGRRYAQPAAAACMISTTPAAT